MKFILNAPEQSLKRNKMSGVIIVIINWFIQYT